MSLILSYHFIKIPLRLYLSLPLHERQLHVVVRVFGLSARVGFFFISVKKNIYSTGTNSVRLRWLITFFIQASLLLKVYN